MFTHAVPTHSTVTRAQPQPRRGRAAAMLAAAMLVIATFAACGGGGGYGTAATSATTTAPAVAPAAAPPAAAGATVKVAAVAALGNVLTDGAGLTLYTFGADDPASGKSACSGSCATAWPALLAPGGQAIAGPGLPAALATIARDGGARQVTLGGRPLYYYAADKSPGDAKGQGITSFGGLWSVAGASAGASGAPATPTRLPDY
jgi:predicted lipoprotein with Yx(FWY)xxD motif